MNIPQRRKRSLTRGAIAMCAGAMAVGFAGCGSSSGSGGGGSSGSGKTIAAVVADAADPYYTSMKCGAQQAADQLHVNLTWQGPATVDTAKEVSALNTVSLTKPDAVMVSPFSATSFVAPVQRLMQGGTPVTLTDGELAKPVALQTFHTDVGAAGTALAQIMGQALGAHGVLAIIAQDTGDPIDSDRYTGLVKAIKAQYPGVTVLPIQYANVSTAKAASEASALMRAHPDLSVFYATNGPQAAGITAAIQSAHAQGHVKVFAFDATPQEVDSLKSGGIEALVSQSPYSEGKQGVQALVAYLNAKHSGAVPPSSKAYVATPFKILTKANVDSPSSRPFLYLSSCK